MTEFFTMAPYSCGAHDPTTQYYREPEEEPENLAFDCAMRNVYGVVLTVIASLGIVGNVFCLVILPKTGGSKSAIVMLFTLGVYDAVFLASGIFLKYLPSITFMGHGPVVASNLLSPVMLPLTLLSHMGAAYTTVAISGERCIAITTPLKVTQWLTTRRVKVVTVLILLWSLAYNIPRIIFFAPTAYWEPSMNSTWYRLEPTDFAANQEFLLIYFGYLNTIFKVVIPIACVSVCNTVLVCCLRRRRSLFSKHVQLRQHQDVPSQGNQHTTATTTSFTPSHSRENSFEKREDWCREGGIKMGPIYRRPDDSLTDHRRESFDCHNTGCTTHSPACSAYSGDSMIRSSQDQSSSFIRLGGRQYHGSRLGGNTSTPQHQRNHSHQNQQQSQDRSKKHKKRTPGAHTGDAKVTSMVLAVTWTFLISQAFAGAQVIIHVTDSQVACGQRCVLFNQFCDLVFVLVSATNFLLYYAFGQRFRRIIRKRFCWRRRGGNGTGQNLADSMGSRSTRQSVR